jgi:hypothetical protein
MSDTAATIADAVCAHRHELDPEGLHAGPCEAVAEALPTDGSDTGGGSACPDLEAVLGLTFKLCECGSGAPLDDWSRL